MSVIDSRLEADAEVTTQVVRVAAVRGANASLRFLRTSFVSYTATAATGNRIVDVGGLAEAALRVEANTFRACCGRTPNMLGLPRLLTNVTVIVTRNDFNVVGNPFYPGKLASLVGSSSVAVEGGNVYTTSGNIQAPPGANPLPVGSLLTASAGALYERFAPDDCDVLSDCPAGSTRIVHRSAPGDGAVEPICGCECAAPRQPNVTGNAALTFVVESRGSAGRTCAFYGELPQPSPLPAVPAFPAVRRSGRRRTTRRRGAARLWQASGRHTPPSSSPSPRPSSVAQGPRCLPCPRR